jgi:G3E family GTPase
VASRGDIHPRRLFGRRTPLDPDERARSAERSGADDGGGGGDHDVRAFALTFDAPLDWTAFGVWLTMLLQARGQDVLRVKGLLDTGGSGPVVLDGVQHVVHPPRHLAAWPDADRRSRLVFIGRAIDPAALRASLQAFDRAAPSAVAGGRR